jgi:hypothetical protein
MVTVPNALIALLLTRQLSKNELPFWFTTSTTTLPAPEPIGEPSTPIETYPVVALPRGATVPIMRELPPKFAVTTPMLFVPAGRAEPIVTVPEMAGSELTVTVVLVRVTPWVGTDARETACVAGKFPTVTVPVIAAPTVTVTFSNALRLFASNATVTVLATVTELATALLITALVRVTTVGVSEIAR